MIEIGSGNLLTQDVEALVNTVNTVGVMGKGIALQFKRAFPANYTVYRAAADRNEVRLGHMFVFDSGLLGSRRYIINFPTKGHWRSRSRLADIETGLVDLVARVEELEISSLAMPALGCGNGGLDWTDVRPLIEGAFVNVPRVRVVVFPPTGAPPAESMPVATARPTMTAGRSALLVVLHRYLERAQALEARDGVSELEIQKLIYFLQVLGHSPDISFARGRYGPYAEQLHHVLQELEGHHVTGYGDRSAHVGELRPIRLTPGALDEATAWLDVNDHEAARRIDRIVALVDGFATPYSLELLATAHFAALQERPTADPTLIAERVAAWNVRKARLFTPQHVRLAADQLAAHGLLPEAG